MLNASIFELLNFLIFLQEEKKKKKRNKWNVLRKMVIKKDSVPRRLSHISTARSDLTDLERLILVDRESAEAGRVTLKARDDKKILIQKEKQLQEKKEDNNKVKVNEMVEKEQEVEHPVKKGLLGTQLLTPRKISRKIDPVIESFVVPDLKNEVKNEGKVEKCSKLRSQCFG